MKQMLKNYCSFTSFLYRIVTLFVYPLVVIGIFYFFSLGLGAFVSFIIASAIVVFVEVAIDYWNFGGIVAKNVEVLNYVKCSNYGMNFIKQVFLCEAFRKGVTLLIILFGCHINWFAKGETEVMTGIARWEIISWILLAYNFILIGTTITRFFETFTINISIASVIQVIFCFALAGILLWNQPIITIVLLGLLAIATTVLQLWIMMKRVRRGYYDK